MQTTLARQLGSRVRGLPGRLTLMNGHKERREVSGLSLFLPPFHLLTSASVYVFDWLVLGEKNMTRF